MSETKSTKFTVGQAVETKDGRKWVPGVVTGVMCALWDGETDLLYDVLLPGDTVPCVKRENRIRVPRS